MPDLGQGLAFAEVGRECPEMRLCPRPADPRCSPWCAECPLYCRRGLVAETLSHPVGLHTEDLSDALVLVGRSLIIDGAG